MSELKLWARRGSIEPHWQLGGLGAASPARAMPLGWDLEGAVDGGVPPAVVVVFSRALATTARVAFLCDGGAIGASPDWVCRGDDWTRSAPAPGLLTGAVARMRGQRGPATLVCTSDPGTIANAFTDARFTWWSQSQVLLLSAPDAPPPAITPDEALTLIDADWATRATPLRRHGVLAVARLAIDGDALGVLALDDGIIDRLLAALADESRAAAIGWALHE